MDKDIWIIQEKGATFGIFYAGDKKFTGSIENAHRYGSEELAKSVLEMLVENGYVISEFETAHYKIKYERID